jgi:hypothetical protein
MKYHQCLMRSILRVGDASICYAALSQTLASLHSASLLPTLSVQQGRRTTQNGRGYGGSKAARQQGSKAARQQGSKAARQQGSKAARQQHRTAGGYGGSMPPKLILKNDRYDI